MQQKCLAKGPVLVCDDYGKLRVEGVKRRNGIMLAQPYYYYGNRGTHCLKIAWFW